MYRTTKTPPAAATAGFGRLIDRARTDAEAVSPAQIWRALAGGSGVLAAPTRARRDRMYRAMCTVHGVAVTWDDERGPTRDDLAAILAGRNADPRSWDEVVTAYLGAYAAQLDPADVDELDRAALPFAEVTS